jgi:membrane-associated protein
MNYYKFFSANLLGAVVWGCGLNITGYFAAHNPALEKASYVIAGAFIAGSVFVGIRSWLKNRKTA